MDWRLLQVNKFLRRKDPDLFCQKTSTGRIDVYRNVDAAHRAMIHFDYQPPKTQYVLSLTDNWTPQGTPVDWGYYPLMDRLNWMDCQRDDTVFDRMKHNREREQRMKEQSFRNDVRARAYDMRREFARATNDINTSLIKGDLKNGNC